MVHISRLGVGARIGVIAGCALIALVLAWLATPVAASTYRLPGQTDGAAIRPVVSSPPPMAQTAKPRRALSDPLAALAETAATSPAPWASIETIPSSSGTVEGISVASRQILYRAGAAHYVIDRNTNVRRRVDTFFDGTPLPNDVLHAAISGDGQTVALLRRGPGDGRIPLLRIVRLNKGENFEFPVPDPGAAQLVGGGTRPCWVMEGFRELRISDEGGTVWFESEPCSWNKLLAIDVRATNPHWRYLSVFGAQQDVVTAQEVTADGRSFFVGLQLLYDGNGNGRVDPGELHWADTFDFPIEFNDEDSHPNRIYADWPSFQYQWSVCALPPDSSVHTDAAGGRRLVSTAEVGRDPDTIVYEPGRQLYWVEDGECQMRSLGGTDATDLTQFALSTDGRSSLERSEGGGVLRRDIASGLSIPFSDVAVRMADPLLTHAVRLSGSTLQAAELSPSVPLKVAILGDSYISGEGTSHYDLETDRHRDSDAGARNLCHRSPNSWAYRTGRRLANYRADHVRSFACSGALTDDLQDGQYAEPAQLIELKKFGDSKPVDVVFMSIGGNDAGFRDMIVDCLARSCLTEGWKRERLKGARRAATWVETVLLQAKRVAPHATIFLTGYPSIVNPPGAECPQLGLTWAQRAALRRASIFTAALEAAAGGLSLDSREQAFFNDVLIPSLNSDLGKAAAEAGVHFINATTWFANRGVCAPVGPYANGLMLGDDFPKAAPFMGNESFHPTAAGHRELQRRIDRSFGTLFRPDANPTPVEQGLVKPEDPDTIGFLEVAGQTRTWGNEGRVTVQRLPSGMKVVLAMYSTPTLLGRGTVGADGSVTVPFTVPEGSHPGLHALVLYDEATGEPVGTTMTHVDPPEECLTAQGDVDVDEDALADHCDASLEDGPSADADGDGVANPQDTCPAAADSRQEDSDDDGVGDACDPDQGHNPADELEPFPKVELPRPPPKLSLVSGPPARTHDRAATIEFTATEETGSVVARTCKFDGVAAPCSSPFQAKDLADGKHRLEISARNSFGATSDPLVVEWTVDTVAPTVFVQGESGRTTMRTARFYFQGWDGWTAVTAFRCLFDGGAWAACASRVEFESLGLGEHSLSVVAVDEAGNESAPVTRAWTVDEARVLPPTTDTDPFGGGGGGGDGGDEDGQGSTLISGMPKKGGVIPDKKGRFRVSDITVECGAGPCVVAATASVPTLRRISKRAQKSKPVKKPVRIASTRFSLGSGDTRWIVLRLTARARAVIQKKKRLKPTVTIRVEDASSRSVTRTLKLLLKPK